MYAMCAYIQFSFCFVFEHIVSIKTPVASEFWFEKTFIYVSNTIMNLWLIKYIRMRTAHCIKQFAVSTPSLFDWDDCIVYSINNAAYSARMQVNWCSALITIVGFRIETNEVCMASHTLSEFSDVAFMNLMRRPLATQLAITTYCVWLCVTR